MKTYSPFFFQKKGGSISWNTVVKERHANDINEGKDQNEISIRNISFKDRLKRKSKLENINDKIKEKEN